MDDRLFTHTMMAAVAIVVAIVAAQPSRAPAGPRAAATSGPAPLILAQYNGCPNGNCR